MQGIQGRSRSRLLQALDNAANGRLALARRVKIFEKLNKIIFGTDCHLTNGSKIVNNKWFSLLIKRPLENFHEIFGLAFFIDTRFYVFHRVIQTIQTLGSADYKITLRL